MSGGDYTYFILAAYGFSALGLGALATWIIADARAQKRALARLEAQGIRRRSSRSSAGGNPAT